MNKAAWYRTTAAYSQANLPKALWQLVNTFAPYLALWAVMIYLVQGQYPYWMTLALAVAAGAVLVRIFVLFHDCCHGSFFTAPWGQYSAGLRHRRADVHRL